MVQEHSAVIKEHDKGFLKDGRVFEIIDFKNLYIADDGSIHSGSVGVVIDGKYISTAISMLAENIDYKKFNFYKNCV